MLIDLPDVIGQLCMNHYHLQLFIALILLLNRHQIIFKGILLIVRIDPIPEE